MGHILFLHSFIEGHLGCRYFLAIMNNTVMIDFVQVSKCKRAFSFENLA